MSLLSLDDWMKKKPDIDTFEIFLLFKVIFIPSEVLTFFTWSTQKYTPFLHRVYAYRFKLKIAVLKLFL